MNEFKIKSISEYQYKEWILKKHYAKRMPCIEYCFGLFIDNIINGIISFGTPMSGNLRDSFGGKYKMIELNRLVVNDGLPKNSLSWFVSNAIKMLPKPLIIVSYADTEQSHNGYIYQATSFIYTGLSAKRTDWKIKGLEHLHGATIADMSRGKIDRAKYMREKYGTDFYLEERSRKHRYFKFIGNKHQKKEMLSLLPYEIKPYPKGENKRYDSTFKPLNQLQLF